MPHLLQVSYSFLPTSVLVLSLLRLGDLRFRAPQPANDTGVFNVTTQPDECWQGNPGSNATTPYRLTKRDVASQNEDCLFLKWVTSVHLMREQILNKRKCTHSYWLGLRLRCPIAGDSMDSRRRVRLSDPACCTCGINWHYRYVVQSVSMFNPVETFVRNSNYSVISVQMQYRLGPFGIDQEYSYSFAMLRDPRVHL